MTSIDRLRFWLRWGSLASVLLLSLTNPILAAAEKPATPATTAAPVSAAATPSANPENWPIRRSPGQAADSASRGAAAANPASSVSFWRWAGSLAIVLLLIFVVRWFGRRFLGLPSARDSSGAIQILCRSPLSPRQRLMLVQVGRRVVLVGDCGSQMNALCEITDPEEVALLLGQIHQKRNDSSTNAFLSLVGRASTQFESAEKEMPESAESAPGGQNTDPALHNMREELSGLLEKVRVLSRHFRQG